MATQTAHSNYGIVATIYDLLGHAYSGGQIRATKYSQIADILPGQRVLYAGVGGGEDAVRAAQKGAKVTVVELSPQMVEQAKVTFAKAGVLQDIEVIQDDIMKFEPEGGYDIVVANFFLNVFSCDFMPKVLQHLASLTKANGRVMISDFRPLSGNVIMKALNFVYYGIVALFFNLVSNNPLHPIYDYREVLPEAGLTLTKSQNFPLFGFGPAWYQTIYAKKNPS